MQLIATTISRFKNFVDAQRVEIEPDVTGLIGKNESGKTTVLKALHRLNPANGTDLKFNVTTEYPRWRLARDRRHEDLSSYEPVVAEFSLNDSDRAHLKTVHPQDLPEDTVVVAARAYANDLRVRLSAPVPSVISTAATDASINADDQERLEKSEKLADALNLAAELAAEAKTNSEAARAKALSSFASSLKKFAFLVDGAMPEGLVEATTELLPKVFYFSSYDKLPGECDLHLLAERASSSPASLESSQRTVLALLSYAGESPEDFLDENYDSRKAELQAAGTDLSRRVFEYWKQNTDLEVVFDTDMAVVGKTPDGHDERHRILKIELRDARHGGVETNFATRSTGFQWFFSFFAAFSEYQEASEPIIVLLDEPGTSLHGEAQKEFVRFVFEELGRSKQTLYTTHSQYLLDPARYESLRAVHDRSTRDQPDLGVVVTDVNLSADRDTILPVESALGYTISQHLFIGSGHHLAVEGSSDFIYLQRMTEHVAALGMTGLDPRLAAIPVGGDANMPAFVALLGRRLRVSALIDGDRSNRKLARVVAAAKDNDVPESAIVLCSDVGMDAPTNADIEDLFTPADYLRLYNWAFDGTVKLSDLPKTGEPVLKKLEAHVGKFDHALPAHALTDQRIEFFESVEAQSVDRFLKLFELLNATLT